MAAFNDRTSNFACVARNFSIFGAKIEFEAAALVPDEMDFEITRKSIAWLRMAIWQATATRQGWCLPAARDERRRSAGLEAKQREIRPSQPETPVAPRSASNRALDRMSTVEGEDAAILAVAPPPKVRRRRRRSDTAGRVHGAVHDRRDPRQPVGRGHAPLSGDAADRRKVRGDRNSAQALAGFLSAAGNFRAHTSIDLTEAAASRRQGRKRSIISPAETRSTCAPMLMAATIAPSQRRTGTEIERKPRLGLAIDQRIALRAIGDDRLQQRFLSVTVNGVSGCEIHRFKRDASSASDRRDSSTRPTEVQKAGNR